MEAYRKTLKRRALYSAALAAVVICGACAIIGFQLVPADVSGSARSFYFGFLIGCSLAVAGIAVVSFVQTLHLLHHEEKLRAAYVKEHDERTCVIWQKAGFAGWRVSSIGLILAAFVSSYWNITVCVTLLGAAMFCALSSNVLYCFYVRKN